jgi:hypothetical protein
MSRKPKFKPVITRIKLNPEQAVLICSCYDGGVQMSAPTLTRPSFGGTRGCVKSGKSYSWVRACLGSTNQYYSSITQSANAAVS